MCTVLVTRLPAPLRWVRLQRGSRVNSVAVYLLTAPRLSVAGAAHYVNMRPVVRRFGHKKVYHTLKEFRRYGIEIIKPVNKRFARPHVWQVIGVEKLTLSAEDRAEDEWRTWW